MIDEFETDRLALRPMVVADVELLADLDSDTAVMRFITGRASTTDEAALELHTALGTRWLVFARNHGGFLGWVGAVPMSTREEWEVGWRFRRSAWGQGYATEAAQGLVDWLFADGARRILAQAMATNERSLAVMGRVGLRYHRTFHLDFSNPLPGTELGEVEYELLRADWDRRHQ